MCRLFGFRSAAPSGTHRSLVEAENALSLQSTQHPDGWGIGWFVDDDAYVIKSATPAHACERFRKVSKRLTSHTFVVHVRRATVGTVDHLNAHPFRFGRWLFAHNGTILDFERVQEWVEERIDPLFIPLILGDTDSECLFFFLLSELKRAGVDPTGRKAGDVNTIRQTVREALLALNAHCEEQGLLRPILNVILTDGRLFLAHRAGMPLFLSTQKITCRDFETCPEPSKVCMESVRPQNVPVNHLLVASEPVDETENRWEEVPDGTTIALDEGFQLHFVSPAPDWTAPILPAQYRISAAES